MKRQPGVAARLARSVSSHLAASASGYTARTAETGRSLAGRCGGAAAAILANNDEFIRLQVALEHFCHHSVGDANANPPRLELLFRAQNPHEP